MPTLELLADVAILKERCDRLERELEKWVEAGRKSPNLACCYRVVQLERELEETRLAWEELRKETDSLSARVFELAAENSKLQTALNRMIGGGPE